MSWPHAEPHPGAYLERRFLEPLHLSAIELARATHMPRSRVSEIVSGKRRISADTALRLAAFFRMKPEFWMGLQAEWDLAACGEVDDIQPVEAPGFLIGPRGAMRLPEPRPAAAPTGRVSTELRERLEASTAPTTHEDREWVQVEYPGGLRALESRRK